MKFIISLNFSRCKVSESYYFYAIFASNDCTVTRRFEKKKENELRRYIHNGFQLSERTSSLYFTRFVPRSNAHLFQFNRFSGILRRAFFFCFDPRHANVYTKSRFIAHLVWITVRTFYGSGSQDDILCSSTRRYATVTRLYIQKFTRIHSFLFVVRSRLDVASYVPITKQHVEFNW